MAKTNLPIFDQKELQRYQRQFMLPEIGGAGQQKIKKAKIAVVGAGGLGCGALPYLAAAGVGCLGIIDHDHIELSNLQRQIIYQSSQLGQAKADMAAQYLTALNPYCQIKSYQEKLTAANASTLLAPFDIIIDGSDNFPTRYLIAQKAEDLQKPLISGALLGFSGSVSLFKPYEDNNPRYQDLFPTAPPADYAPPCSLAGIIGPIAGIIGNIQALEAIKLITGAGESLLRRLLIYDGLKAQFKLFHYGKNQP